MTGHDIGRPDEIAAALLVLARLRPSSPEERDRMLAGYAACRAMAEDLWRHPLGDTAPLLLPPVDV